MFKYYRKLQPKEFLVIGYDMAMGGDDYCSVVPISKTNVDVPFIYNSQETATITTNKLLQQLKTIYEVTGVKPILAPETNNGGIYEINRMLNSPEAMYFTMYKPKTGIGTMDIDTGDKYGFTTSSSTRPKMLEELKNAVDNKLIRIYDRDLVNQMYSFIIKRSPSGWKPQAEQGQHDDLVMALAIAWQLYQTETPSKSIKASLSDFPDDTKLFNGGFY